MVAHVHTSTRDLVKAIDSIRPSVLIGGSFVDKAFPQVVIEAISRVNERPIIFALSNLTERTECAPEEAYRRSQGKGIYAVGVQFPLAHYKDDNLSFNCSYGRD
jgi:malate dehydrogenase (oxaloacetate-decarboxylating)(NADP+)